MPSHTATAPSRITSSHRKTKRKKYLKLCQENRENFTPFVVTVDGVFGQEANLHMKQLACALSKKWSCHLSYAHNYVMTMMSIAV
eukprot:13268523-Ditylum_brightwellii.AAC.1